MMDVNNAHKRAGPEPPHRIPAVHPMKQTPRVPETFTGSMKKKTTDALMIRRDDTREESRQRVRDLVKLFGGTVKVRALIHSQCEVDAIAFKKNDLRRKSTCCRTLGSEKLILEVPLQTQEHSDRSNLPHVSGVPTAHCERMSRTQSSRRSSSGPGLIARAIKVGIVPSCIACYARVPQVCPLWLVP